jgi:uncharacterized protein YqeY
MYLLQKVMTDYEKASQDGDTKRAETLDLLRKALMANAASKNPKAEQAVLGEIIGEIQQKLSTYDDYVTADHGLAKINYRKELDILKPYLDF